MLQPQIDIEVNPDPVPSYFDTAHILTYKLGQNGMKRFDAVNVTAEDVRNRFMKFQTKLKFQYNKMCYLQIVRDMFFGDQYCISRVDVALDIPASCQEEADLIRDTLRQHLIAPWYKKEFHVLENGNFYTKPQNQANTISVYSGRDSKVTGEPCCHVESRLLNASACRREGIQLIDDLYRFDYVRFWNKYLNLRQPNPKKLFRLIKKRPDLGFIHALKSTDLINRCPAQLIKVLGHRYDFRWQSVLDKVDNEEYISRIWPVVCQSR